MEEKEYGLVLAGGGTKGAYEVGVWKALKEMNINITAVVGASIGALNGALFLQDLFHKLPFACYRYQKYHKTNKKN